MKAVVVGGGISGLVAAYQLRKKGHEVELYEATRFGGSMGTKLVDGFSFELGPRTFQTEKCPQLLALIQELGLEVVHGQIGSRYLWHRGRLRKSFCGTLLYAAAKDLIMPRKQLDDETVYEFALRRCGKRAAELFFDPMAKGIYGGDIRKLSLRSAFPSLYRAQSFVRGVRGGRLFTIRGGMQKLVDALALGKIERVDRIPDAELVVLALPFNQASQLTGIPLALRNEPVTVVNLGYHGEILPLKGYGYLVPTLENESILGQIWDTNIFPVPGQTKVTSMVRGKDPIHIALDAMKRHLNIARPPDAISVREAEIPQYEVGHHLKIAEFEKKVGKRVVLVGNYLEGASVEACVARAMKMVTNHSFGKSPRGLCRTF
jgi:oxygen-dependent protoporphyrinogen oxidase